MQQIFERIDYVCGSAAALKALPAKPAKKPFSEDTVAFLDAVSASLRTMPNFRSMPDVAAFSFWCRRASIEKMAKAYGEIRLGRGVVLHFAPSNIPALFAFSQAAGLLAGNCCAVKLPSKLTPQAETIGDAVRHAAEGTEWEERIVLFRCGHEKELIDALTALCDVRVIWGGDASVEEIRRSPLKPRATELPFADRQSLAVLNAESVIKTEDISELVHGFYNDTYLNDQNACSSPRIVYWLGDAETVKNAQVRFWKTLADFAQSRYVIQPVTATGKLTAAAYLAAVSEACDIKTERNLITRVQLPKLSADIWEQTVPGGFFVECFGSVNGLLPALTEKCQTIALFGVEKTILAELIAENGVRGGDRLVPVGHTLDFTLTWDGHDLIREMSREINL